MVEFIFSDEAGRIGVGNYYLRSVVVIPEKEYFKASNEFLSLKEEYGIPKDEELKTSDIWFLKICQEKNSPNLEKRCNKRLKKYLVDSKKGYEYYMEFLEKSLKLIPRSSVIIVVWTYFFERVFKNQRDIERDFLQTIMLRIEDELKEQGKRGIILYDVAFLKPLSRFYSEIFLRGEFVEKYSHIKDSIAFEVSTYSFGIQVADYISNIVLNALRGYKESRCLFIKYVRPKLRKKEAVSILRTGFIPLYLEHYRKGNLGESLIQKISWDLGL